MVTTNLALKVKTSNLNTKNIIERTFHGSKKGALYKKEGEGRDSETTFLLQNIPPWLVIALVIRYLSCRCLLWRPKKIN